MPAQRLGLYQRNLCTSCVEAMFPVIFALPLPFFLVFLGLEVFFERFLKMEPVSVFAISTSPADESLWCIVFLYKVIV